jgi:hypothetical protein
MVLLVVVVEVAIGTRAVLVGVADQDGRTGTTGEVEAAAAGVGMAPQGGADTTGETVAEAGATIMAEAGATTMAEAGATTMVEEGDFTMTGAAEGEDGRMVHRITSGHRIMSGHRIT